MVAICFYFQVHEPIIIKKFRIFDIGNKDDYFDDENTKDSFSRVSKRCYLPMNKLLLELIEKNEGKFKVTFSISGIAIELMEKYEPEVLESFKRLAQTGSVEFLSETYYHSLSFLYSKEEFKEQIEKHRELIKKHFNFEPKVFRNTELIYTNELASFVEDMGYKGILAEGFDNVLGNKSPNVLYNAKDSKGEITLFTKNYKLSDDIQYRFSNRKWSEWPLTTDKYTSWINRLEEAEEIINLFMEYETFGEKNLEDTGIINFIKKLPEKLLIDNKNYFVTPSEAINIFTKKEELDVPFLLSWMDKERDISPWIGNKMQKEANREIFELEKEIKELNDDNLLDTWRKLTTSDHFYYMSTKYQEDDNLNNPYGSPYDAYIYFMNILNDLVLRIKEKKQS